MSMQELEKLQKQMVNYVVDKYKEENILLKKDFFNIIKENHLFNEIQNYFIEDTYYIYIDFINNQYNKNI